MSYSMGEALSVAKQATVDITDWLSTRPETIQIQNVELELDFQKRDVDIVWTTQTDELWLEIKGDRWHQTSNFFFETHSNLERGTSGCFLIHQSTLAALLLRHPPYSLLAAHARDTRMVHRQHRTVSGTLYNNPCSRRDSLHHCWAFSSYSNSLATNQRSQTVQIVKR